ncbi:DUF1525 domain-containing protein [Musicola paradisiaca]|uniref:DUF1525 domain-containing protein n=1 Tax=Musicola paradisiaca TaxID=69223 RepID=UPI0008FC0492|nr:DUF1525 domain-containing protein [Musicola paradisiaca]
MKIPICCLPVLLLSAGALADTVIYTDRAHPVPDGQNVSVVFLDAPEHLQAQLFDHLSADPAQAEQDVSRPLLVPRTF